MDQHEGLSGVFRKEQVASNDITTDMETTTAELSVPVPVPKSDLAKRMPTLLTYLLAPSSEAEWLKPPEPKEQQVPSRTGNESPDLYGVQQLVQEFKNMSTGHRLRTKNKTIRKDRKILSARPYNTSHNIPSQICRKNILEQQGINFPPSNRRRMLNSLHGITAQDISISIGDRKYLASERLNTINNNNNVVYTPSLMDIPEYPSISDGILSPSNLCTEDFDFELEDE